MKDEQLQIVGRNVILAFGARNSICMFNGENWQKYCNGIRQAAASCLTELEKQQVYRQMIATRANATIDAQKRFRIPQPHLSRAHLPSEHPEVDIIYMSSEDCEWLEIWPKDGLSSPEVPDDPYNRTYNLLIAAMREQAGVGADVT